MRRDESYLLDMLIAARKAARFAGEIDYDRFETSDLHQNAILKVLEIVGEAASRISDDTIEAHPGIPWAEIVGFRNRIAHAYFAIDLLVVWNIVNEDVPQLILQLEKIAPPETE